MENKRQDDKICVWALKATAGYKVLQQILSKLGIWGRIGINEQKISPKFIFIK